MKNSSLWSVVLQDWHNTLPGSGGGGDSGTPPGCCSGDDSGEFTAPSSCGKASLSEQAPGREGLGCTVLTSLMAGVTGSGGDAGDDGLRRFLALVSLGEVTGLQLAVAATFGVAAAVTAGVGTGGHATIWA